MGSWWEGMLDPPVLMAPGPRCRYGSKCRPDFVQCPPDLAPPQPCWGAHLENPCNSSWLIAQRGPMPRGDKVRCVGPPLRARDPQHTVDSPV